MASAQQFIRNGFDHEESLSQVFREMKSCEQSLDVTLITSEGQIQAHKVVLSACSPFFKDVLNTNVYPSPMIYLKGVSHYCLEQLVSFMYEGEVNIHQEELHTFLDIAADLQVKGLNQKICDDSAQTSKRQRTEPNQGNTQVQVSPPNLNMIFYSNPVVKSEPNTAPPTTAAPPNTTVYMNPYHGNMKLEQTLADISKEASLHSSIPTVMAGTVPGLPSGHFQVGTLDTPGTTAPITGDNQAMIRLKPSTDLLNSTRAKILENKSLGLWMCSACTFTHPVLVTMQNHIQSQHF